MGFVEAAGRDSALHAVRLAAGAPAEGTRSSLLNGGLCGLGWDAVAGSPVPSQWARSSPDDGGGGWVCSEQYQGENHETQAETARLS